MQGRFGCRYAHDEVGFDECRGNPQRHACVAEVDEIVRRGVMDDHAATEPTSERSWHEQPDLAGREPTAKTACNEDRHLRDTEPFELIDRCLDRFVPRVGRSGGNRQQRMFDHDRGRTTPRHKRLKRWPGEGEAKRLTYGSTDVADRARRCGRT